MNDVVDRFLAHAQDALRRSANASTETKKAQWLSIAQDWMKLAEWLRAPSYGVQDSKTRPIGSDVNPAQAELSHG